MRRRELTPQETANLAPIKSAVGDHALLFPSGTGLDKSILDATIPLRALLRTHGIHDYSTQRQGTANRVMHDGQFIDDHGVHPIPISLYRPPTKEGDPRIWPSRLGKHVSADEMLAVAVVNGKISLFNLTRLGLAADIAAGRDTPATLWISSLAHGTAGFAESLLCALRGIAARGPLTAVGHGDTAIGRTIEHALGISMNSRRAPDYHGIELKSYRSTKPKDGLITLFSQVPDWSRGFCRPFELLQRFGYDLDGRRQLYCSVRYQKPNPQQLQLLVDPDGKDLFCSLSASTEIPLVWSLDNLRQVLSRKHPETFWIMAKSIMKNGLETFQLTKVRHTKRPVPLQFDQLLMEDAIRMDLTLSAKPSGAVRDHGYLFRAKHERFHELFTGEPRDYDLI
jgi:hypothetical protein